MKCNTPGCTVCDETSEEYMDRKGFNDDTDRRLNAVIERVSQERVWGEWPQDGFVVCDREDGPCAWIAFEINFGWVVYPFGRFRACVPQEGESYTSGNHGVSYGFKLPTDPFEA